LAPSHWRWRWARGHYRDGVAASDRATEGRYAQVAQEMAVTGDWVTPRVWMNEGYFLFWENRRFSSGPLLAQ
jgi:4-amino-4-deoxy-L-arabinose transferase-like glycosyltransferase